MGTRKNANEEKSLSNLSVKVLVGVGRRCRWRQPHHPAHGLEVVAEDGRTADRRHPLGLVGHDRSLASLGKEKKNGARIPARNCLRRSPQKRREESNFLNAFRDVVDQGRPRLKPPPEWAQTRTPHSNDCTTLTVASEVQLKALSHIGGPARVEPLPTSVCGFNSSQAYFTLRNVILT